MDIYRYKVYCYKTPVEWYNNTKDRLFVNGKTIDDCKKGCGEISFEFITDQYSDPNGQVKKHILAKEVELNLEDSGLLLEQCPDRMTRTELNPIQKGLEFCERAELKSPKLQEGHKDMWSYLEWCSSELLAEEVEELKQAISNKDKKETLDAAYDVAFVAMNISYKLFRKLGFKTHDSRDKAEEGYNRVCDNNLSKIKNVEGFKAVYRKDGKVLKPQGHVPPDFDDLLSS